MSTPPYEKNTKKEKIKRKLKRVALQFTPKTWLKIRWINPKSSPYRVFQLWCLTMLFLITELNTFFFKHFVNYRSSHFLCWGRIIFICIMAAPSIRQFYIYVTDFRAKNLGSQCWLYVACITMETLINIKFGWTSFEKAQFKIIVNWMGIAALACAVCLYFMAAWSELTVYIFNDNNKNQLQNQNLETLKEESLNINSLSRKNSSNSPKSVRSTQKTRLEKQSSNPINNMELGTTTSENDESDYIPSVSNLRRRFLRTAREFGLKNFQESDEN